MAREVKSNKNWQMGYDFGQLAKLSSLNRPKADDRRQDDLIDEEVPDLQGTASPNAPPIAPPQFYDPRTEPSINVSTPQVISPPPAVVESRESDQPVMLGSIPSPISNLASSLGNYLKGKYQDLQASNRESRQQRGMETEQDKQLALQQSQAALQQAAELEPPQMSQPSASTSLSSEGGGVAPIGSPETQVTTGSVDAVAASPEARYQLTQLAGPEINDEMLQTAKAYEAALDERTAAINDEVKGIRERIESERLSNQDLFFIGLAVLISSIAANASEPGAFANVASSGLGALVNRLDVKKKDERKGLERISKLGEERTKSEMERIKIQGEILKAIPNHDVKKMLAGRQAIAKDGQIIAVQTRNPDLWVDPQRIQNMDAKELKKFDTETVTKAGEALNVASDIQQLTQELIDVYGQLNNQLDANVLPNGLWQYVGAKNPRLVYKPIKVDGKIVDNPVAWASTNLNRLKSLYLKANRMGNGALTGNALAHMDAIFPDVKQPENVFKADLPTMIATLEKSKMTLADDTIGRLKADGFMPEMLEQKLYNVPSKSQISATGSGLDYGVKKALQDPKKLERAQAGEWVDL